MFPEKFFWGVSMSGFQFEMGDPEGKYIDPNSDWFKWVHDENNIRTGLVSGDLPENGVNYWQLYKEDHALAKQLGMNAYRLNIEWSRVFPKPTYDIDIGFKEKDGIVTYVDLTQDDLERIDELANQEALNHYHEIILDLRERGFKVILNLVHFTLPLWLHDPIKARSTKLGKEPLGWLSLRFKFEFAKFAAYIAWKFGDIIDMWSTFNEPSVVAEVGYLMKESGFPPGVENFRAHRKVLMNIIQAHTLAHELIKKMDTYRADNDSNSPAEVGLIHNLIPFQPHNPRKGVDIKATDYMNLIHNEWILNALTNGWIDKNFNKVMERGEVYSFYRDRLDWLGVNYYTRGVIKGKWLPFIPIPAIPAIVEGYGFNCEKNSKSRIGRPTSDFGWEIYPEGLEEVLLFVSNYNLPIIITENGIADEKDTLRPTYIVTHIAVLERLIEEKKVDVRGYLHWALTDNYEWSHGFKMKFGLFHVDLNSKKRTKRPSADVLKRIIMENDISSDYLEKYKV